MSVHEARELPTRKDMIGVALVAALIALALAFGAQRGRRAVPFAARAGDVTQLSGPVARYAFFPASGRLEVASADGHSRLDLEMSMMVDGAERPLVMRRGDVRLRDKTSLVASFPIEIGDERARGTLELRMDPSSDMLIASLAVLPDPGSSAHSYAIRFGLSPEHRTVFVPGTGELGDLGSVEARTVLVDDDQHPFAFVSTQGPLTAAETPPDVEQPGARPRLVVSARTESTPQRSPNATLPAPAPARLDLGVVVGGSSQQVWGRLYHLLRASVARVNGVVTGTKERSHLFALDDEGRPVVRAIVDAGGRFSVEAPTVAVQWYAALEASQTSAPVRFTPGTGWDLKLDVSPGGEARIRVVDGDTGEPLVTRIAVKGIDGTIDPSFGPDYRASGAGPIMDLLESEVTTGLPAGRYRISASKGFEWSIDAESIEITSGHTKNVDLALRHVVPTPGSVGCDLHVHARPSFDSPVTPEDRVLSLVSAGVDFAVPTEHNMVGDYGPAIEILRVGKQFAFVPGVEVTTYNPRFGHFGVFPYPLTGGIPPYKGTNAGALVAAARRGDPNRIVQINHPRLPQGIGYFSVAGFDPKAGRGAVGMRLDFDALEVYNGFDLGTRARVEKVMEDWFGLLNFGKHIAATGSSDSHRIQYQWAGYPRTYALVDPKIGDGSGPIETAPVIAALKKGRSFVTSGPLIELELVEDGRSAKPGDELVVKHGAVTARLRVRAAPWVDVTSIELIAGSPGPGAGALTAVFKKKLPTIPTKLGKEPGTLEEAAARSVRFEGDIALTLPPDAKWLLAVVKGDRTMDDILPAMPIQPLGFTNPIWLGR